MASHYDAVGLEVKDDDLWNMLSRVAELSQEEAVGAERTRYVWTDPSGARVVMEVEGVTVVNAMPSFKASAVVPVRDIRLGRGGVATVELVDQHGAPSFPIAVELEDRSILRALGGSLERGTLALAGLAEEIVVTADDGAEDALIPSGLLTFDERGASARASITGRVWSAERRLNRFSEREFVRLGVRTSGLFLDLLASSSQVPEPPAPGSLVRGTFFLVGRLGLTARALMTPSPSRRRWWRR